jgi:hypothetical protein
MTTVATPEQTAPLTEARAKEVEDNLNMLVNLLPLAKGNAAKRSGTRVDISHVWLIELPDAMDRVFAAIEVSEALGHRVECEILREGRRCSMIGAALQFYAYRDEPAQATAAA